MRIVPSWLLGCTAFSYLQELLNVEMWTLKHYFPISGQRTLERSCFLTPGNDTCFTEDDSDGLIGICYCHTDLCNHAARPTTSAASFALPLAIVMAVAAGT